MTWVSGWADGILNPAFCNTRALCASFMRSYRLNMRQFLKTIVIYYSVSIFWTYLCISFDEFTDKDKGLASGLGYLVIFSLSFYLGSTEKQKHPFFIFTLAIIAAFLVLSFVMTPVLGAVFQIRTLVWIVSAIANSIALTWLIGCFYEISTKYKIVLLTIIFELAAYFVMEKYSDALYNKYHMNQRLAMFVVFQGFVIVSLTLGISIRKPAHNMVLQKAGATEVQSAADH